MAKRDRTAYNKEYYRKNSEKLKADQIAYRKVHMTKEMMLFNNAKNRAKAKGIPIDITEKDIVFPEYCPVLGIKLEVSNRCARDNSPSIDRTNPSLGYVKGNIAIISHKANTIKSNASVEDVEAVLRYMKGVYASTPLRN